MKFQHIARIKDGMEKTQIEEMNPTDTGDFVSRQTAILLAVAMLFVGFIAGVVLGVIKTSDMPGKSAGSPKTDHRMIQALEDEVSLNPQNPGAWAHLGNIHFDKGQYEKAIQAYEKSLAIEPGNPNVLTDLGVMYRRNDQPRKAVEAFSKAMAIDPKHEVSRMNKGIVLLHDLNDEQGAVQVWEELLKINPMAAFGDGQSVDERVRHYKDHENDGKKTGSDANN